MFISYAIKLFLIHFVSYIAYMFAVIFLTLAVFFVTFGTLKIQYLFFLYLLLLCFINYYVRFRLFFKTQLRMNVMFLDFLDGGQPGQELPQLPLKVGEYIRDAKEAIGKVKPGLISRKLIMATAGIKIYQEDKGNDIILSPVWNWILIQWGVFILFLIPFGLVSLLFTMDKSISLTLKYLIYLMGFLFTYFLNLSVVEPFIYLLVQKKFAEHNT
jgi:hypothetical protein